VLYLKCPCWRRAASEEGFLVLFIILFFKVFPGKGGGKKARGSLTIKNGGSK